MTCGLWFKHCCYRRHFQQEDCIVCACWCKHYRPLEAMQCCSDWRWHAAIWTEITANIIVQLPVSIHIHTLATHLSTSYPPATTLPLSTPSSSTLPPALTVQASQLRQWRGEFFGQLQKQKCGLIWRWKNTCVLFFAMGPFTHLECLTT